MGNQLFGQMPSQMYNVESCIKDICELEFMERIRINRFLKTIKAKLKIPGKKEEKVLVKVFIFNIAMLSLTKRLSNILNKLGEFINKYPIFCTYNLIYVTDKAGILIRPYIFQNLYDRLVTRPFLKYNEKIWIIYELLKAFEILHKYITHGDIKLENILITSWNFIIISDLSAFIKPIYFYSDTQISDFNYYFDTSGRRSCYISPERFLPISSNQKHTKSNSKIQLNQDGLLSNNSNKSNDLISIDENDLKSNVSPAEDISIENDRIIIKNNELVPSMDIFSLGCLIYELITDGKILFTFSDQVAYSLNKKDQSLFNDIIHKNINDNSLAEMICSMISREPSLRLNINDYLNKYNNIFKGYFPFIYQNFAYKLAEIKFNQTDPFLYWIYKEYEEMISLILSYYLPNEKYDDDPGILFILSSVISCSYNLKLSHSKTILMNIMLTIAQFVTSDIIINRILPCVLLFCEDNKSCIRAKIPEYIIKYLDYVNNVQNTDSTNIFSDYIFPKLRKLECDPVLTVRIALVKSLPQLCSHAFRFYNMYRVVLQKQQINIDKEGSIISEVGDELESLYNIIQALGKTFLTDSSSFVRRAYLDYSFPKINELLNSVLPINNFNRDLMLSHSIAVLNNKTDWQLRQSFFKVTPKLIEVIGLKCADVLFPLLQQGLFDSCEWVISSTLECVKSIIFQDKLSDHLRIQIFIQILPFLIHPNSSIRYHAIECIGTYLTKMSISDYYIKLLPFLKPYLNEYSESFINYFTNSEQLSAVVIKHIPYRAFEVIVNRETSNHFIEFLTKRSSQIFAIDSPHKIDNDIEEMFEEADESVTSFFNFMKSCNLSHRKDLLKILLIKDYIKTYSRDRPLNNINADFGELYEYSSGWPDISILSNVEFNLSKGMGIINNQPNHSICNVSREDMFEIFLNYLDRTIKLCISDINRIIRKKIERYNTYIYAKDYVLKGSVFDLPSLKINEDNGKPLTFISQTQAHMGSINKVKSISSTGIFTTISDDCSVKIWNINSLDSSNKYMRFKPIQTYNRMSGRINALSILEVNTLSDLSLKIACSSHDTSDIQVFDVERWSHANSSNNGSNVISKYYVDITVDGFVVDLTSNGIYSTPLLLAATLNGAILCYDIRSSNFKNCMRYYTSLYSSHLTSIECDPYGCWITTSTYNGEVILWDTRFSTIPIRKISSKNKSPITKTNVSTMNSKKVICSFGNTIKPLSIFNLETGLEEASFSIFNNKCINCTGMYNINTAINGQHIFFSCTDNLIRNWNVNSPKKSSILVPSIQISHIIDRISYSSRVSNNEASLLETRESISIDPRLANTIPPPPPRLRPPSPNNNINKNNSNNNYDIKQHNDSNGALYNFCTDITYLPSHSILVATLPDGVIRIYK